MQPHDSGRKLNVKCKPFSVLSDVSLHSSTTRRSTRIASRANEDEMGENANIDRNSDEDVNVIVRKRKTTNKCRSQNKIQSSYDEDDDDYVSKVAKPDSPKKKRSQNNPQSDFVNGIEPKRKTPVKRRKPLITIKCNKITDYFGKSISKNRNEVNIPNATSSTHTGQVPSAPEALATPPADVIVLSSSDERDDIDEQVAPKEPTPPPIQVKPQQRIHLKCPDYKVVQETNFAVDAFRFGEIAGVTAYFLTHFHSDHYDGLTRKFKQPVYMSAITGRLVKAILKVNAKLVKIMNINTLYVIDEVEVTAIDANHCPGAVMFIFKLPCGRTILHTGDFRATPEMESNPVFWNNNISTIYLDTTYLHKSYNFGTQNDALLFVEDEINKFKQKNAGKKFVIVVGSYMIGKERLWSHIAQTFRMQVWLEAERKKAFELIYTEENESQIIKDCVCDVREEAQLHVIPIKCVNYGFLMEYLKNFKDHILLAFRPTGWAQNTRPQYGSRVSIVGVQYSEHSSYSELKRFVRFVQPEVVIATVPISSGNPNTKNVPTSWLSVPKPIRSSQSTMTSFMKSRKNSCPVNEKLNEITQTDGHYSQELQPVLDDGCSYDSLETDFMP